MDFRTPHPGYIFNGKTYRTITGLMTALAKDASGNEVAFPKTTVARVTTRLMSGAEMFVGWYDLTDLEVGKPQVVTRRDC